MKKMLIFCFVFGLCAPIFAQKEDDKTKDLIKMMLKMDSIEKSFKWETGKISLKNGMASVEVPSGFRFLNAEQSRVVLENLWGNPANDNTLGMIFPQNQGPLDTSVFAFNLTYEEMGYVKDDDADKLNYQEMMTDMQKEAVEANKEREKAGYEPIQIVGWASQPFYEKATKVLHWAKEIKFGNADANTLNYDIRALGRKGVLSMNAIGGMESLPLVRQNIQNLVAGVAFSEGNKYADFNPKVDNVAAWTIGGLVAGKVLAKVGFFGIILKFLKPILLVLAAAWAAVRKFLGMKKKDEADPA
jgi:uncharacterized membrane-anchored protein